MVKSLYKLYNESIHEYIHEHLCAAIPYSPFINSQKKTYEIDN